MKGMTGVSAMSSAFDYARLAVEVLNEAGDVWLVRGEVDFFPDDHGRPNNSDRAIMKAISGMKSRNWEVKEKQRGFVFETRVRGIGEALRTAADFPDGWGIALENERKRSRW